MMDKKIFLAILLACIPIVSFLFSYVFSVQSDTLEHFKSTYALYYLDFLFIIFNALLLYAVKINKKALFISLAFSAILLTALNYAYWTFQSNVGIAHLIFAIIEMSLLITAIFSKTNNKTLYLIMMIPVMIYFLSAFIIELFIYKPIVILEAIPHLIGLIVVVFRLARPKLFHA